MSADTDTGNMAAVEHEIRSLAAYLCVSCGQITLGDDGKVPSLKTDSGSSIKGLATIAKYLGRKCKQQGLIGMSVEDEAIISQWLEYRVTQVDRCAEQKDLERTLQEMNSYLQDKVYFVGHHVSLADLVLYHGLHHVFSNLSFYEKQKYMHLSRWFDEVQHCSGVKQELPIIYFQKNIIYTGSSH